MPSSLDCSSISPPPRTPVWSDSSPPSFRRRGSRSLDKVIWGLSPSWILRLETTRQQFPSWMRTWG